MFSNFKVMVLLAVLAVASVTAGDQQPQKSQPIQSKWLFNGLGVGGLGYPFWLNNYWGLGSFYGFGCLPFYNSMWFKSVDSASDIQRRSIAPVSLHSRGEAADQAPVTCKNAKGQVEHFHAQHCSQAARKLADHNLSKASCGTCTLSLVGAHGQLAAKRIPHSELESAALNILKTCNEVKAVPNSSAKQGEAASKTVALLLSKGDGSRC